MKTRIILVLVLFVLLSACASRKPNLPGRMAPDSPEYLLNEGVIHLNAGQLDQAEAKLKAALVKNPKLINAHNALGLVYTYRHDFPKAIACLEKAVELNPLYYDALNTLGMLYTETGEYDKAKSSLLIAANASDYMTPENACVNLALLEIKFNKLDSAMRHVEKGLQLNKRFAPLYNLRGGLLENLGKLEDALDDYEQAINLQPELTDSLVGAARVLSKLGRKQEALEKIEAALGRIKDPADKQRALQIMQEIDKQE